ncbi:MAG: glycosyltransferase family 1 protein [Candidatus Melainabacteria bacterium]|nr:glycosyltransferase family 1 protein [Candidatus Melainabacteria bacterium]
MKAVFITTSTDEQSFEQIMWLRTTDMIKALERRGVVVLQISYHSAQNPTAELIEKVLHFNPDFFIAPNYNFILLSMTSPVNLFKFVTRPIVAIWDDPLGALANSLFYIAKRAADQQVVRTSNTPIKSNVCPVSSLDVVSPFDWFQTMRSPNLLHFSWDSGHMSAVAELGLVEPANVHWYPISTFPAFIRFGMANRSCPPEVDVAFCGNIYLDYVMQHEYWKDETLQQLTARICTAKSRALEQPTYSLMRNEIEGLSSEVRDSYGLWSNRYPYWDYYRFLVWHASTTLVRLSLIGQIKHQISIYGLFADPNSAELLKTYPNIRLGGNHHHFNELPRVYAAAKVNVCLTNGLIYQGVPSKLVDCVASGGFALCDPKDDLLRLFGTGIKRIFFRDADELNKKIDYYLERPEERAQIVAEMQEVIRKECTLDRLFDTALSKVERLKRQPCRRDIYGDYRDDGIDAKEILRASFKDPAEELFLVSSTQAVDIDWPIQDFFSYEGWAPSKVTKIDSSEVEIKTSPACWQYAATLPCPKSICQRRIDGFLRIDLTVKTGKVGISIVASDLAKILLERCLEASASRQSVYFVVEEFPEGSKLLVRNANTKNSSSTVIIHAIELFAAQKALAQVRQL